MWSFLCSRSRVIVMPTYRCRGWDRNWNFSPRAIRNPSMACCWLLATMTSSTQVVRKVLSVPRTREKRHGSASLLWKPWCSIKSVKRSPQTRVVTIAIVWSRDHDRGHVSEIATAIAMNWKKRDRDRDRMIKILRSNLRSITAIFFIFSKLKIISRTAN